MPLDMSIMTLTLCDKAIMHNLCQAVRTHRIAFRIGEELSCGTRIAALWV